MTSSTIDAEHLRLINVYGNPAPEKYLMLVISRLGSILCQYAYKNQDLLGYAEDELALDASEDVPGNDGTPSPSDTPRLNTDMALDVKGADFWSQVEKFFAGKQKEWGNKWSNDGWKNYICETLMKDKELWKQTPITNLFMASDADSNTIHIDSATIPADASPGVSSHGAMSMNNILSLTHSTRQNTWGICTDRQIALVVLQTKLYSNYQMNLRDFLAQQQWLK
ncbi:hypothetical protein SERLA73DRAFT_148788 [Serpula lacrymans var. lacrymans S7.3]|uniref:Uncharacterized protein n=1 Tax=Serpula lacrymans var. lacrymans (strain S7.3) TaxID=936435 RepID=F8PEU5_SERL3|nr:hypothetical protein SERLA73DRAFT_148788 [Serpula lacrymans var. lacrymans S7.3]